MPPDGMDMRAGGGIRGGGRGGMITQDELRRRMEQQKQQQQHLNPSQVQYSQRQFQQKIYEQNTIRFNQSLIPTKSPSPLHSIGRPADFYGQ